MENVRNLYLFFRQNFLKLLPVNGFFQNGYLFALNTLFLLVSFEVHEVDEEGGAEEERLVLNGEVDGKGDAEVVGPAAELAYPGEVPRHRPDLEKGLIG